VEIGYGTRGEENVVSFNSADPPELGYMSTKTNLFEQHKIALGFGNFKDRSKNIGKEK
jgi:hypothetical protein